MPNQRVYLETTIASYLTARPSKNVLARARQQSTRKWWQTRRHQFDLFVSQLVLDEAAEGDPEAAQRRLKLLHDLPLLAVTDEAGDIAEEILKKGIVPARAADDAMHLALAGWHGLPYLLTWNFRHLANAELLPLYRELFLARGHEPPMICTPDELMGAADEVEP